MSHTGLSPISPSFPAGSAVSHGSAGPRSLATTNGVSIDFLSSGYLDVSVPRVRSFNPMCSGQKYLSQPAVSHPRTASESDYNELSGGFPHSEIHGSKPIPGSPWLNAGYHVLHRLLLPRHPPNALFALDLTRKEQGRWFKWPALPFRRQKSYTYPCVRPTPRRAVNAHG